MKLVWKLVEWAIKAAIVIAGVVAVMEVVDLLRERERCHYLVDEDFND